MIIKLEKINFLIVFILLSILGAVFVIVNAIGQRYGDSYESQELANAQRNLAQEKYDIRRLKLTDSQGKTIEILANGTIVSTFNGDQKTAVLGFNRLKSLFSSLSEEELRALQAKNYSGNGWTLTVETKSGQTYTIQVPVEGNDGSEVLEDLIEDIEETEEETFNLPTPAPTPNPTQPPVPTPSPTPSSNPEDGGSPTPTPTPENPYFPIPTPSNSPVLVPFNCTDYPLIKKTVISNIICDPAP